MFWHVHNVTKVMVHGVQCHWPRKRAMDTRSRQKRLKEISFEIHSVIIMYLGTPCTFDTVIHTHFEFPMPSDWTSECFVC